MADSPDYIQSDALQMDRSTDDIHYSMLENSEGYFPKNDSPPSNKALLETLQIQLPSPTTDWRECFAAIPPPLHQEPLETFLENQIHRVYPMRHVQYHNQGFNFDKRVPDQNDVRFQAGGHRENGFQAIDIMDEENNCLICFEERTDDLFVYLACGHNICKTCLNSYAKNEIDHGKPTIICPEKTCSFEITGDFLEANLDPVVYSTYLEFITT